MIHCPECGTWTTVLENRDRPGNETRRRYQCANLHRFTTIEVIANKRQTSVVRQHKATDVYELVTRLPRTA